MISKYLKKKERRRGVVKEGEEEKGRKIGARDVRQAGRRSLAN
jgi:hypothetical protein